LRLPERAGSGAKSPGSPAAKAPMAMQITGCKGKYTLINDTYEPNATQYKGRPCWVARSVAPVYLFHTGKSRWVVSKRMDDGARCYAFLTDEANSDTPASCKGSTWMCCGDDGNWTQDPGIKCKEVMASQDPFVAIRVKLEEDMKKFGLTDEDCLKQMWRKLDKNGDDVVDLDEITLFVNDLVKSGVWPNFMNCKVALERAFKQTLADELGEHGDSVEKEDFHALLLNIFWFTKLDEIFQEIDTDDDDRLDLQEFIEGMKHLGVPLSAQDAEREFQQVDQDSGGTVDFGEFCLYIRQRLNPDHNPSFDQDAGAAAKAHDALRRKSGEKATHGTMTRKKNFADFDKLEAKIKALCAEPDQKGLKKLWTRLDFNGNNVVSLAEIDKWVVEQYPLLNHKPALIRAQKATLEAGDGDDWVEKREFKMLIVNLFYYNKLFWLFDQVDNDHDRRMDFKEFQWCLSMCGVKMSEFKARSEFAKVDTNGGGIILFDEFCKYFTAKECPQGMAEFIADE